VLCSAEMKRNGIENMDFSTIFKNCFKVNLTEGGYFPVRFSKKQLEVYKRISLLFEERSLCPSGVVMEFVTDCPEISFCYKVVQLYKPNAAFDIYENDVLCKVFKHNCLSSGGKVVYKRQGAEKSKITIYLPHLAQFIVNNIEIGSFESSNEKEKKLLFLGDSITQGMTAISPSMTYTSLIARHFNASYLNQAVAGECFREESLDQNLGICPDVVLVAYGTNDVVKVDSIDEIERNICAYFDKLISIYSKSRIYAITPIWRDFIEDPSYWDKALRVRHLIWDKAQKSGCQMIDGLKLVPHLSTCYFDATTHPNEIGFHQYALNLCNQIVI
jgi:hypothetical protein